MKNTNTATVEINDWVDFVHALPMLFGKLKRRSMAFRVATRLTGFVALMCIMIAVAAVEAFAFAGIMFLVGIGFLVAPYAIVLIILGLSLLTHAIAVAVHNGTGSYIKKTRWN